MSKKKNRPTYAISTRSRNAIVALALLFGALVIWLDHSSAKYKWHRPKAGQHIKVHDLRKYHGKAFTVINVVDGDTIDIDIPDGHDNHTRIRLWGIDTPETKHPELGVMYFGPQAAEFTKKLALEKKVTVYLDEDNRTRGKFGRLLAYVQLPDGRFLNEVLIIEGFAYADVRFRHSFYNRYKQLESAARSQNRGLWQNVTPDQFPQWRRKK